MTHLPPPDGGPGASSKIPGSRGCARLDLVSSALGSLRVLTRSGGKYAHARLILVVAECRETAVWVGEEDNRTAGTRCVQTVFSMFGAGGGLARHVGPSARVPERRGERKSRGAEPPAAAPALSNLRG